MGVSLFIELPELPSIQYLTDIFPLTLSLSPRGEGRSLRPATEARGHFMVVTEKEMLTA